MTSIARSPGPPVTADRLAVLAAVALGGAVGALLRHGVEVGFPVPGPGFPWPTLAINVSGSLLLAMIGVLPWVHRRPLLQSLLGPGLLGGYTTLSAYAEQGRRLLEDGRAGLAAAYLLLTLAGCLLGCLVGAAVGRRLGATGDGRRGLAA